MILRIISGKFGGRIIQAPNGKITHPMSERVRGSLFNIIDSELEDAKVLDAFAGTGSLGLEALSRGARHVTFVERDRVTSKILNENINTLDVANYTTTTQIGLSTWIDKSQDEVYDIIFVDPPYNNLQLSTVSRLIGLLKSNGLMILSYPGKGEVPSIMGVVVVDNRSYGNAALTFYRKK
ncbi:MAG: rRNA (guanine966-N2)-methyltransferase [Patescibacteria group bacterium]|nr:rRNA (guanine966-N2)-methyltransferase [Patescibacteria group bacterium]